MPRINKLWRVEKIICEAYESYDRTMKELATFHNVSVGTIQNILRRNGIKSRSQGRRRLDGKDLEEYRKEVQGKKENVTPSSSDGPKGGY